MQYSQRSYAWSQLGAKAAPNKEHDHSSFYSWGVSHFRDKNYAVAAKDFEEAFKRQRSKPNLLRYAAEAHWRSGNKEAARATLAEAIKLLPGNRTARLRMLTMKFPPLGLIIGSREMKVPT
ncbi:tetratricopeptide repeat protein [Sinorhizobium medicae]|uniref:tetratricopeptide repeat protein n=1 Tax=Sinorhizobium medicae TaxID=110321 RepID=UPI00309226E1|nr:tetratricopeptide repeat protein [Sinorhizobium medicae]